MELWHWFCAQFGIKNVPKGGSKCSRMCSRSTPVGPNAQECALARRLSIQMLKNVLSLDACRSNFWKACMGSKLA